MNKSIVELIITGEKTVRRKGEYLIEHAVPLYCAEVLMRSIAEKVKDQFDVMESDDFNDVIASFRVGRDYIKVLDYLMAQMEKEILPALQRLHEQQDPSDIEEDTKE